MSQHPISGHSAFGTHVTERIVQSLVGIRQVVGVGQALRRYLFQLMDVACWRIALGRGADQQHHRRPFISAVLLERKGGTGLTTRSPSETARYLSDSVQARNF